jgi:hypothetical protein
VTGVVIILTGRRSDSELENTRRERETGSGK